jgi:hypothetical protein
MAAGCLEVNVVLWMGLAARLYRSQTERLEDRRERCCPGNSGRRTRNSAEGGAGRGRAACGVRAGVTVSRRRPAGIRHRAEPAHRERNGDLRFGGTNARRSWLLPSFQSLNVDLYLSADDRFQQILNRPGEPLHVSTNGGSPKQETDVSPDEPYTDTVVTRPGFVVLNVDATTLSVELRSADGKPTHRVARAR